MSLQAQHCRSVSWFLLVSSHILFPFSQDPGMAKAVADTDSGSNQGGFTTDGSNITGFSTLHDAGTGGAASLGNFALFPYASCPNDEIDNCAFPKRTRATPFDNSSVNASPGYFGLTLSSGVEVDMTTARRTSLFRFTFPSGSGSSSPLILMDLTDLSDSRQDNASISVDSDTGRMTGSARFLPSFGSGNYVAYFCADFSGATIRDSGIFVNSRASSNVSDLTISRGINGYPLPGGAFVRFQSPSDPVLARVGVSYISSDQACSNAESEISDFNFNSTQAAAVTAWKQKLEPIVVSRTNISDSTLTNFYSGIYRTFINPQDYTGENPLWQSDEPYFDSLYCIWDLFRSQLPFLTVVDPDTVERIARSLVDTYVHEGWLPDCRMSLSKGYTQGGSNADNVLVDAYLKNVGNGSIDWTTAYEAVVQDAEVEPYDWCCEGRGGLDSWKNLGYIPVQDFDYKGFGTMTRTVSRSLEYSYNDFVISKLAAGLGGKDSDVEKYQGRSDNWQNLFKTDQTSSINGADTGFTGFFQPKYLNETWGFQDPIKCSNIDTNPNSVCSLQNTGAETFESSIWEYSL